MLRPAHTMETLLSVVRAKVFGGIRVSLCGLLLTGVALLCACGEDDPVFAPASGLVRDVELVTRAGRTRVFDYYRPASVRAEPPLVVVYHGGQGNAAGLQLAQAAQSHWLQIADEEGLLVIFPNGTNTQSGAPQGDNLNWNDCRIGDDTSSADDVGFSLALIDWAISTLGADPARVFLSGASNGGMMSMRVASEAPDRIAAFASFIGSQPDPSECSAPRTAVPALLLHGTEDPLIPYAGGCVSGGTRGCVTSAPNTVALWRNLHPIDSRLSDSVAVPDRNRDDGSTVRVQRYRNSSGQILVQAMIVNGGGHQIPSITHRRSAALESTLGPQNADIESVRWAWAFFAQTQPAR